MANHKRKKARSQMGAGSQNYLKRRLDPSKWRWWQDAPSGHNILFNTRPRRREERLLERKVLKGEDPDGIAWPLATKPFDYYW